MAEMPKHSRHVRVVPATAARSRAPSQRSSTRAVMMPTPSRAASRCAAPSSAASAAAPPLHSCANGLRPRATRDIASTSSETVAIATSACECSVLRHESRRRRRGVWRAVVHARRTRPRWRSRHVRAPPSSATIIFGASRPMRPRLRARAARHEGGGRRRVDFAVSCGGGRRRRRRSGASKPAARAAAGPSRAPPARPPAEPPRRARIPRRERACGRPRLAFAVRRDLACGRNLSAFSAELVRPICDRDDGLHLDGAKSLHEQNACAAAERAMRDPEAAAERVPLASFEESPAGEGGGSSSPSPADSAPATAAAPSDAWMCSTFAETALTVLVCVVYTLVGPLLIFVNKYLMTKGHFRSRSRSRASASPSPASSRRSSCAASASCATSR